MKPNIGKAILGGFVGTVLLTLMTQFVAPMMTGHKMDMAAVDAEPLERVAYWAARAELQLGNSSFSIGRQFAA